ncbi:hypothetical protein GGR57DRAFT_499427 [Xylariaceae sp. FL1272]|nr:hypothetical protein GGR57DRAFT_499427 [Xylariaceae sp. FL1272]
MSGRSAYVRKKITEPKTGERPPTVRGRAKSSGSSRLSVDDGSFSDHPMPPGTGYGTTNARFLKFADQGNEAESSHPDLTELRNNSGGSQSGGSDEGRRDGGSQNRGPMPDYAYARARKPVLKTEDVSGIERSGFRSNLDKRSDDIRKGLTKAFTLGLKKKKTVDLPDRAPSSATIRPLYDPEEFDMSGVPALPTSQRVSPGAWDPDRQQLPPPSSKLPAIPTSTAPPMKRWMGSGRPVQKWNKLRKDPELWDPNGDVLVYFGRKDQPQRPNPSFRLSSHIIEATESRFLVTLLREGSTEDDYDSQVNLPPSPVGAPPMVRHSTYAQLDRSGQATPPVSEDNALAHADGQISYEMYFPTPSNMSKFEAHRHAITTRNVFALLYHASLVGLSLYQALSDLLARLDAYMQPDADNVGTILNYLSARGIDDARNDPEIAVSMLAWSETPEVRWGEGWREAFLHCAGMYSRLDNCADFKHLTPITRALLERACLETQLRVQAAEERLAGFSYTDAWPTSGGISNSAGKAAAERLQSFLLNHYSKTYGTWPPEINPNSDEETWLSRTVAQALQRDFGALYDYLVNRDIVWDESETRSSRKWMMVSQNGNRSFEADTPDLPLTDILIEYDNRSRFPHIPHPYPLVPDSVTPSPLSPPTPKLKKDKNASKSPVTDDRTLERRVQLAYTEATNIYMLGSAFTSSALVESFVRFEKADHLSVSSLDPFTARRGRWVLLYFILQTLASVSVDSPNARYKDGVSYHLSPRLKGTRTPPWKGVSSLGVEAGHEMSYCWLAPRAWQDAHSSAADSDASMDASTLDAESIASSAISRRRRYPNPPSSVGGRSTATITSTGGYITPSLRSHWGDSGPRSVSAWSDDASSVRTPTSSMHALTMSGNTKYHRAAPVAPVPRSRGNDSRILGHSASSPHIASQATSPSQATSYLSPVHPGTEWPVRTHSMKRTHTTPHTPLDLAMGSGDFFDMPHIPLPVPGEAGKGAESGAVYGGPVIRDFDELDLVVEEGAFEKS